MNEPRDYFLAGSRLAEQQHSRFRGRNLRRLLEHLRPRVRLSDDPAVTSHRVELGGERLHSTLELSRPLLGLLRQRGGFCAQFSR